MFECEKLKMNKMEHLNQPSLEHSSRSVYELIENVKKVMIGS